MRLLGDEAFHHLSSVRVIIFGVGGVGSWCAESLVRSGIGHLTIVDCDHVCVSNLNRQLMATIETIGRSKVEVLAERLGTLMPGVEIEAIDGRYTAETADEFDLDSYDFVVDAIDSLSDKALLILRATASRAQLFSSMGAALKLDPTKVKVAEFWKVEGCPLARALRQRFKRIGVRPSRKFQCVFSDELLTNKGVAVDDGAGEMLPQKAQFNGSMMHITAIFGLTIAGLIVRNVASLQK